MAKISEILDLLNDGKWHRLEEIRKAMGLNRNHIQQIVGFLKQYEFIAFDETKKMARLDEAAREFMAAQKTTS